MNVRTIKYRVVIRVEKDGDEFHAFSRELKGLHVFGATDEEALENAREGVITYLDTLVKHGKPIPLGCIENDEALSVWGFISQKFWPKPSRAESIEGELQLA
jgi:predicted RNase H-like HicB family nuclease